jgi:hypothetical protein
VRLAALAQSHPQISVGDSPPLLYDYSNSNIPRILS